MMELDPEAHRILDLARSARTPSAEDKARVERRFALALGLTAASASAAASAQAASSLTAGKSIAGAVVLKWWVGGGAVLAVAFAGYAMLSAPPASSTAVPAPRPVSAVSAPAAPSTEPVQPRPAAAAADVAGDEQPQPATGRTEARRRAAAGPSLAAELELLHRAQSAWRAREAARALSIVDEHRARYPRSALRVEREGLQVLALCELGRKSEAARVARALLAREPLSPLRAAIEQSCALK